MARNNNSDSRGTTTAKLRPTRYLTTKLQVSGWKFLQHRNDQAITRWEVSSAASPFTAQQSMFGVGFLLVGLIVGIGLLFSILKPAPSRNATAIIVTPEGGRYVMFNGALHPVPNLASARLITGKNENASPVKGPQIAGTPRGAIMGIPSAPDNLSVRRDDNAFWAVCDWRTGTGKLSITASPDQVTTIIAGKDAFGSADDLGSRRAVLARSAVDPSRLWMLWNGVRSEVGLQDFTSQNALGLTPEMIGRALVLSGGIINAVPTSPALSTPPVDRRGQASPTVTSLPVVNGDVITTVNAKGDTERYAVLPDGVQRIGQVIAQMLLNTGGKSVQSENSIVTALPQVSTLDTASYPDSPPDLTVPGSLCYTWSKSDRTGAQTKTALMVSDTLPVSDKAKKENWSHNLQSPAQGVVQASSVVMRPGEGFFARVTGNDPTSASQEQLLYIDELGTRYFISPDKGVYDQTVNALGINVKNPDPIPWNIAMLFMQGSNLGFTEARVEHGNIPIDQNQSPVAPPGSGSYNGPAQ